MPPSPEDVPLPQAVQDEDGSWVDAPLLLQVLPEGATILHADVQRAIGKGDNYLSVLYRTQIQFRIPDSNLIHKKNVIVKGLPPGEFMQKYIDELDIFRREISMYSEVLPSLYAFADSRLKKKAFKKFSATYHKCMRPDTLILDDLKPEGFVMAPRRDRLDLIHAKLVVQNLARLHALSIAFAEENHNILSKFEDIMFGEENRERLNQFLQPMIKALAETIQKWGVDSKIINKIEKQNVKLVDKLIEVSKIQEGMPWVLIHGDCWVNNILFKYSEDGELTDLRFVDYQMARKSSPAIDLQYFFFSSLRNEVRSHHFDDLLREYCKEFAHYAHEFGYRGEPFTLEFMHREMERTTVFAFMTSIATLGVVVTAPDDSPDMESVTEEQVESGDIQLFDKTYESRSFREAFEDLLPYFDERGVFD